VLNEAPAPKARALSSLNCAPPQPVKLFHCMGIVPRVSDITVMSILELIVFLSIIASGSIMTSHRTKETHLHCAPVLHSVLQEHRENIPFFKVSSSLLYLFFVFIIKPVTSLYFILFLCFVSSSL
jgi:hypothetical protein